MERIMLCVLILLLLTLTFPSVPSISKVSATANDDLYVDYGLSEDIPREPMPENYTTKDYLNTTNPYSQVNPLGEEGNHPLYVLVFGDEEERPELRLRPTIIGPEWCTWAQWAEFQLERGDNALAANFGIDIRILGFLEWDTDDSKNSMYDLWNELEADTKQYLRTWYEGEWWSNYVDAIIGITAQATPGDPTAGIAPAPSTLDQGRVFVLLKWQVYWADDNLVQHEVSHLYYADDHYCPPHCSMASLTNHPQYFIWEDALWWVWADVPCSFTTYSWCESCNQTIQQNCGIYPLDIRTLVISASSGGTTDPPPGNHTYRYGKAAIVTAIPDPLYLFYSWNLDGAIVFSNPINVTMDSNHTLKAHFGTPAMKTLTDGYFYVPNIATDLLKIEMLFNNSNLVGDQTGGTSPYPTITAYPDGKVDMLDLWFIITKFGINEGGIGWDYMADINPDRKIDMIDQWWVSGNYGKSGTYITNLTGVTVRFNTGEQKSPDSNGFVTIPQGATSFTVTRYGTPIGTMVIFW